MGVWIDGCYMGMFACTSTVACDCDFLRIWQRGCQILVMEVYLHMTILSGAMPPTVPVAAVLCACAQLILCLVYPIAVIILIVAA